MADSKLTLAGVLADLQSSAVSTRRQALKNLKHLLQLTRSHPLLNSLKDKNVHVVFDKLFTQATQDRSSWVRASKGKTLAAATEQLQLCSSTFRCAVETFCPVMRAKTVKAILGHIIQTLPTADGQFCLPLTLDYFKSMSLILEHQPHTEHLDPETWKDVVDFCVESIADLNRQMEDKSDIDVATATISGSLPRGAQTPARPTTENTARIAELFSCIRSLVSASASPLLQAAAGIVKCVCDFLRSSIGSSTSRQTHFAILNSCLMRMSPNSGAFVLKTIPETLPLIRSLWIKTPRENRDEMLATMVYLQHHIAACCDNSKGEVIAPIMEDLFQTMVEDYLGAREKTQLNLDDILLGVETPAPPTILPMQSTNMYLKVIGKDAEFKWTLVNVVAFMAAWLDVRQQNGADKQDDAGERSPKRQRMSTMLELLLLQEIRSRASDSRIKAALNLVYFLVQTRPLKVSELEATVDALIQLLGHEDPDVTSWAMLCLSSYVY